MKSQKIFFSSIVTLFKRIKLTNVTKAILLKVEGNDKILKESVMTANEALILV